MIGVLVGSTNYMAAKALENNNLTIFNMAGFAGKTETETDIDTTITSGSTEYKIAVDTVEKEKKNFYEMYNFMDKWGLLFWLQNQTQKVIPYVYILMLEVAVGMVFSIQVMFQILKIFWATVSASNK